MLTKLLIYTDGEQSHSLAFFGDELRFIMCERQPYLNEAIFVGRVANLNQPAATAFIEYLPQQYGFLNLSRSAKLQVGSPVVVQVSWPGDATKQPKLRRGWNLVGKYTVYTAKPGAAILRSAAATAAAEDISAEQQVLCQQLTQLQAAHQFQPPCQITPGLSGYRQMLRELPLAPNCEVICNNQLICDEIIALQEYWPIAAVSYQPGLEVSHWLHDYYSRLDTTKVELANGASLEIHSWAGINVIDINGGSLKVSSAKLNYLVLDTVYREICWRNLHGIILLDVVKNMNATQQQQVVAYLQRCFKVDISQTKVLGYSHTGLCELVRNKS